MKTLVHIHTQYYENYNFYDGGTPHWKPKGGHTFTMRVDDDLFLYEEDVCISAIKSLLQEESNNACRYEYVEHELIFSEPTELKGFEERVDTMLEIKYASQISK